MLAADGVTPLGVAVYGTWIIAYLGGDVAHYLLRRPLAGARRPAWKLQKSKLYAEADAVGRASAFADGGEFLSGEGVVAGHEPLVEVHRQLIESNALRG